MKKIFITGFSSNISKEFIKLTKNNKQFKIIKCGKSKDSDINVDFSSMQSTAKFIKYILKNKPSYLLICHGVLHGLKIADLKEKHFESSVSINMSSIIYILENITKIKELNAVVISSISGKKGSYDNLYASSKAGLNLVVKSISRQMHFSSRLNSISPGIISDTKMTRNRNDKKNLENIKNSIPTKTFSTSLDVAKMIHYLFFEAKNINGADIDINGGHY